MGTPHRPFTPPMPSLAPDNVSALRILSRLGSNALSAFPARCLREDVIRLRFPGGALVLVNSPEGIRHVLLDHQDDYGRIPAARRVLGPIVGQGLVVSEGDVWRRQRRIMAPAFTPRAMQTLADQIMSCADSTCARIDAAAGQPIDLLTEMRQLGLTVAASTMFSLETVSFGGELQRLVAEFSETLGHLSPGDIILPPGTPTLLGLRRLLFRVRWIKLIRSIIATRRAQARPEAPRDLFDMLADAHGDGADQMLIDEVGTMLVAGHATTALTLFWACLLVAQAPEWQDYVAEEVAGLDLSPGQAAGALSRLVRTRAVIQEALRLYPVAFMTARLALCGHEICDVEVPRRSIILIPFWVLHRNPRWWPAPDNFDPTRFLAGPEPKRFTYLPFGAGPHICLGAHLAMTEATLVLARLIQRFKADVSDDRPILPIAKIVTEPDHSPSFVFRTRESFRS